MKVGLYGGMANNMYVAAAALHKEGIDTCFIHDRADSFAFSQPLWQDIRWAPSSQEINQSVNWSQNTWREREAELGWIGPKWCSDPQEYGEEKESINTKKINILNARIIQRILNRSNAGSSREAVIQLMRRCDILMVCGVSAVLLARLSGIPYVIWPHGEDIRQASGNYWVPAKDIKESLSRFVLTKVLANSFKKAAWIGTHDPQGVSFNRCNIPFAYRHLPLPMPTSVGAPDQCKNIIRENLNRELNLTIESDKHVWLIPSRIDKYWKKQQLFIKAILSHTISETSQIIISGWGKDCDEIRQSLTDKHFKRIIFLKGPVSKPILYDFYRASDVVVDQFRSGTYGTTLIESASVGTPVLSYINNEYFIKRGWMPPPVLNGKTEEDIKNILNGIYSGNICPKFEGTKSRAWVEKIHGGKNVVPKLKEQFENALIRE